MLRLVLFNRRMTFQLLLALSIFLLVPFHSALAQVDNATLTGLVSDLTGAVVPGARVVINNQLTNRY